MTASPNAFQAIIDSMPDTNILVLEQPSETKMLGKANSHVHLPPNFTAFETIEQAVTLTARESVNVLGASNYYDYSIYSVFAQKAVKQGIFPLFGLEIITLIDELVQAGIKINDPGNPGKMYVCGKGITKFDPMTKEAAALLQVIRDNDSDRMDAVADKLASLFQAAGLETGLDADKIKDRIVKRHGSPKSTVYLQERHLAQAFQEVVFEKLGVNERAALLEKVYGNPPKADVGNAAATQNDIRSFLIKAGKPAFVPETFVDFDHAYSLILALAGIPCYPILADGVSPICGFEETVEDLIERLKSRKIYFAEIIPIRNSVEIVREYAEKLRGAGLVVTAGTEHNTLDMLPIDPTCINGVPIPVDLQEIFWDGACVVAAHQYLIMRGEAGFVDENGSPNPNYSDNDARIKAFAKIGSAVISRYSAQARE